MTHATRLDVLHQQAQRRAAKRDVLLALPTTLAGLWLAYAAAQFFTA